MCNIEAWPILGCSWRKGGRGRKEAEPGRTITSNLFCDFGFSIFMGFFSNLSFLFKIYISNTLNMILCYFS